MNSENYNFFLKYFTSAEGQEKYKSGEVLIYKQ